MKKITENIPLISACLIFIGYLNYEFYYNQFDINISSYLTTTELIFSFLPLTQPFLYVLVGLIIFVSIELVLPSRREYPNAQKPKTIFHSFADVKGAWIMMLYFIKKENKSLNDKFFQTPIFVTFFIIAVCAQAFLLVYIFLMISSLRDAGIHLFSFTVLLILSVIWILLIYAKIDMRKEESNYSNLRFLGHAAVICISIGLLNYGNREDAINILEGAPKYITKIELDKSTILTDTVLVYIGQTSNYIFLRDRKQNENQIIPTELVKKQSLFLHSLK